MIYISHRGNINGPNLESENKIDYIDYAISKSFLCEIDVWVIDKYFFLSHDYPENILPTDISELDARKEQLIIHCKNIDALCYFNANRNNFHYFWHETDSYTLTNKNFIWVYPGKPVFKNSNSICVLPERNNQEVVNFGGVCSDYIAKYKALHEGKSID